MGYCLTKVKLSQGVSVAKHDCLVDNNSQMNLFVWDTTEPIATRPLFMLSNPGSYKFFYTFDGNKNVSELVHFESRNGIAAHCDYAPFGAVTRAISASAITDNTFTTDNPFRLEVIEVALEQARLARDYADELVNHDDFNSNTSPYLPEVIRLEKELEKVDRKLTYAKSRLAKCNIQNFTSIP